MLTPPAIRSTTVHRRTGSALRWLAGFDPFGRYAPGLVRR